MCACTRTCIHTYEVDCTHGSCARRFSLTASHACSTLLHECSVMNDGKRWSGSASVVSWVVSLAPVLYRHESLAALQSACPQVKIRAMTHLSGWAVYPSPTAAVAGTSGYQRARMRVCVRACVCAVVGDIKPVPLTLYHNKHCQPRRHRRMGSRRPKCGSR